MPTLIVNLSEALQSTLGQQGVYAWAVSFDNNHDDGNAIATQTQLVDNGSVLNDGSTEIELPGNFPAGKVYFIIQSVDPSASDPIAPLTFGGGNVIQEQSDINWQNASTYDFRYDSFEVSFEGTGSDAGNLTDVNAFGIPMSIKVEYPSSANVSTTTQTRGYAVNGSSIFADIKDIDENLVETYTQGPLQGESRLAPSPTTVLTPGSGLTGFSSADWQPYVESLGANAASEVQIAGYFVGAASVNYTTYNGQSYQYNEYHNPGFYSYTLTWTADKSGTTGTYVFKPASNSQILGTIFISSDQLANSIYATYGSAVVKSPDDKEYLFSTLDNGKVVETPDMNVGANNQWGAFFTQLLTGFDGGYLGSTATPQNSLLGSDPISLSQSWNFDPTFAFGGQIAQGHPGAVTQWSWDTSTYGNGVPYDPYASIFFADSNSYGNGYTDNLMSQYQQGGPLIPVGYNAELGDNPFSTKNGSSIVTVTDANASSYAAVGAQVTFANATGFAGLTDAQLNSTFTITKIVSKTEYEIEVSTQSTASVTGGGDGVSYSANVPKVTLTLYDDNEQASGGQTLPQIQQYTQPVIYDTSAGPFVAPEDGTGQDLSLVLNFGLGAMRVNEDATVKIGFYKGQSSGLAAFDYVTIPSSSQALYQTWNYEDGKFAAAGGVPANGSTITVNDLPYATGINWYQIQISHGSTSRTYNLYAQAVEGAGVLNPDYVAVDQAGSLAIDGLAQVGPALSSTILATQQYTTSLNVDPFGGGTLSMDPALLELITDPSIFPSTPGVWEYPAAPVLGTVSGSTTFTNWGGSEQLDTPNTVTVSSNNGVITNTLSGHVTNGSLAFGWWGADQQWIAYNAGNGNPDVIKSYTNKVSAWDFAEITFNGGSTAHNPIKTQADIDGKWITAASNFSNGTYAAVMTEYLWSDETAQVARQSEVLEFTVSLDDLDFMTTANFIQLDGGGSDTAGNWIRLETVGSTMPNGTLLVYVTDTSGNLVSRDGETGAGVTLDDAIVARVGVVESDGDSLLFSGAQSVYLPVGQQLHFAVETGDGHIEALPGVQVTGTQSLSVSVEGDFGTVDLSATVDNVLSSSSTAAESQRESDQPWIYLEQGATTHIDIAGSAWNINSVHFVRIDVDHTTGDWSVGGAGYANTDAFRAAVEANWDPGFQATGGRGDFKESFDWTASTGSGYYAPVLVTEGGDVFVIGKANVDGMDHIRTYGENSFGFEDLRADQLSDFDYNDLVLQLTVV